MGRRKSGRKIHGVLLLDKPQGVTSNRCLQVVRRLFNANRAGHTGSLDPMATGLLPVCFGEATKFAQFGLDADKSYVARAKLGVVTETGDADGQVVDRQAVPVLTESALVATLAQFTGEIQQVPSMYSALKYQGRPLYEYARKGVEVPREARPVTIHSLDLIALEGDEIEFSVRCSKGTYIRTLAEDIGKSLGCGAHLIKLRRTAVRDFDLAQTVTVEDIEALIEQRASESDFEVLDKLLLPVDALVGNLPKIVLDFHQTESLLHGQKVRIAQDLTEGDRYRLYSAQDSRFIGLGVAQMQRDDERSDRCLAPFRLISTD